MAGEPANDCEAHIHQAHYRSAMRCIWLRRSISVRLLFPRCRKRQWPARLVPAARQARFRIVQASAFSWICS